MNVLSSLLLSCTDNVILGKKNNLRNRGKKNAAIMKACLHRQLRKEEIQERETTTQHFVTPANRTHQASCPNSSTYLTGTISHQKMEILEK